jgi:hypothetical protein
MMLLTANAQAATSPVIWDTANAIAGGTGCPQGIAGPFPDTWVIAADAEVLVIFSRLGVDLTLPTDPNVGVHNCLVGIPVTIDQDFWVGQIDQFLLYGYSKDANTVGKLNATTTFCNQFTNSIAATLPATADVQPFLSQPSTTYFTTSRPPFCQGAPVQCVFQASLSVAAQRANTEQGISVHIFGEDVELQVLLRYLQPCP